MTWSFREKSIAITTAALIITYTIYFYLAFQILQELANDGQPAIGVLFIVITVAQIVLITVAHIATAISNPRAANQREDERDRYVENAAEARSSILLGIGAVITAFAGIYNFFPPFNLGNIILFFLVVSEVAKGVLQLKYYRRGI